MPFVLTKDIFDDLINALDERNDSFIEETLNQLHPEDITVILYELDTTQCIYIFNLLEDKVNSQIISYLDSDTRIEFASNFEPYEIAKWVQFMDSDDAADILNELPLKVREKTLAFLHQDKVRDIVDLLHYDENSAGGLMAKELIRANLNWTVIQAIEEIRRQAKKVAKIYSLYVVNNDNVLLGRVSLKKIILSKDDTLIKDIFDADVIAVKTYQDEDKVADIMQRYDLDAVPVINAREELVGRITIDDIVDVITEKAELDRQIMSGISEDIEEDDSILMLTRARLPWLIIGMVGGLLGARFIGFFESQLTMIPAMAFFIPLITATGGNVGIQSSSIILQSLANKSSFLDRNYVARLLKVLVVAIINGMVIGMIVFGFSFVLNVSIKLAFIVAVSLFFVVLLASVMGTITPLILDKMKINPAIASGPFITTANDLLGLGVYFTIAHFLYN